MKGNTISEALSLIRKGKSVLKSENILQHEKPIHVELAEWLAAEYYNGKRANSGNQKGWDIVLKNGEKIQVKSHAKADTNISEWTQLSKHTDGVSLLFIVVFSIDLYIKSIYEISIEEAESICNKHREVTWGKLERLNKALDLSPFMKQFPFLFLK